MALVKFFVKLILSKIDHVLLSMFRKFDFVVGVNKELVNKLIMYLSGYGRNAQFVRFMNDIGTFVNPHDITKNS